MRSANSHNLHRPDGSNRVRARVAGFTLLEVLTAVAIVSILVSLAAPSFTDLIASQRTRAAATDLYLALAKARSEAIKRNTNVTLSPKGGGWEDGWEIVNPSDAASRLEDHNPLAGIAVTGPASVVYQSTGRIRGSARPEFEFSFTGASSVACVSVDLSGMPTQKSSSC